MKKVALCLHDIRLSGDLDSMRLIDSVLRLFHVPLTVHMVLDAAVDPALPLMVYLRESIQDKAMEVVFHGLTHTCSPDGWPLLAWYHKGQAEYAVNDPAAREQAREAYARSLALAPDNASATWGQLLLEQFKEGPNPNYPRLREALRRHPQDPRIRALSQAWGAQTK